MKSNEAIKKAMGVKKVSQSQLAKKIGKPSPNAVGSLLTSTNMTERNLTKLAGALDLDVVLKDKDPNAENPIGEIKIDSAEIK